MRRCSTPPEVLTLRTRAPSSPMSIFMQNITRQRRGIVGWCADFRTKTGGVRVRARLLIAKHFLPTEEKRDRVASMCYAYFPN